MSVKKKANNIPTFYDKTQASRNTDTVPESRKMGEIPTELSHQDAIIAEIKDKVTSIYGLLQEVLSQSEVNKPMENQASSRLSGIGDQILTHNNRLANISDDLSDIIRRIQL